GLLQRQRDPPTLKVDVDDLDHDFLVDLDDLLRYVDVASRELRDVNEALNTVVHAYEGAEGHELRDLARDDMADLVRPGELLPRIFLGRLERQRDPFAIHVHIEDFDGDLLA